MIQFEWDENKSRSNLVKHGLDFDDAKLAFNDENGITLFDKVVGSEVRYHLIAEVEGIFVTLIVYTTRNEVYHIISARPASKKERKLYNEQRKI